MKFPSIAISKWLGRLAPDRAGSVPLLLLFIIGIPLQAAEEADPSQKLREQLRSVTLQLRTSQTDAANAQAHHRFDSVRLQVSSSPCLLFS